MGNNSTTPQDICRPIPPSSDVFSSDIVNAWGAGGVIVLLIPGILTLISIGIYAEEIYYVMLKSNSKPLRNALLWILSTFPAIMTIALIGMFVPRAVVEVGFMYNIYVAYAIYKYYYLIIVFAGGTKPFVEKSCVKEIGMNAVPCPCLVCLPPIRNSVRVIEIVKWLILQYVVITPLCGAIAVILRADGKYYKVNEVSPSVYLSLFSAISTLLCIYGIKLLFKFTVVIEGMEDTHAIRGKTACIQLTSFIVGFEALIFNIIAQVGWIPCVYPLNFLSNRRVIYNYFVILQIFFVGFLGRHYYRRSKDIQRQVVLHDDLTIAVDYSGRSCLVADATLQSAREHDGIIVEQRQSYHGTDNIPSLDEHSPGAEFSNFETKSRTSSYSLGKHSMPMGLENPHTSSIVHGEQDISSQV
ncbi:organic solute transporter subunit alpha-like isoform X1 [Styela clava]